MQSLLLAVLTPRAVFLHCEEKHTLFGEFRMAIGKPTRVFVAASITETVLLAWFTT